MTYPSIPLLNEEEPPPNYGIRELIKDLALITQLTLKDQKQKKLLGRLRRQRDKLIADKLTQEVAAAIERLTTLGWSSEKIAGYITALVDNHYEAALVADLKRCFNADLDRFEPLYVQMKKSAMQREWPMLWTALQERF